MISYVNEMEINIKYMAEVLTALMDSGYVCLASQDGEPISADTVVIKYVHPDSTGHDFLEVDENSKVIYEGDYDNEED
jgi:hypothetical protein